MIREVLSRRYPDPTEPKVEPAWPVMIAVLRGVNWFCAVIAAIAFTFAFLLAVGELEILCLGGNLKTPKLIRKAFGASVVVLLVFGLLTNRLEAVLSSVTTPDDAGTGSNSTHEPPVRP